MWMSKQSTFGFETTKRNNNFCIRRTKRNITTQEQFLTLVGVMTFIVLQYILTFELCGSGELKEKIET